MLSTEDLLENQRLEIARLNHELAEANRLNLADPTIEPRANRMIQSLSEKNIHLKNQVSTISKKTFEIEHQLSIVTAENDEWKNMSEKKDEFIKMQEEQFAKSVKIIEEKDALLKSSSDLENQIKILTEKQLLDKIKIEQLETDLKDESKCSCCDVKVEVLSLRLRDAEKRVYAKEDDLREVRRELRRQVWKVKTLEKDKSENLRTIEEIRVKLTIKEQGNEEKIKMLKIIEDLKKENQDLFLVKDGPKLAQMKRVFSNRYPPLPVHKGSTHAKLVVIKDGIQVALIDNNYYSEESNKHCANQSLKGEQLFRRSGLKSNEYRLVKFSHEFIFPETKLASHETLPKNRVVIYAIKIDEIEETLRGHHLIYFDAGPKPLELNFDQFRAQETDFAHEHVKKKLKAQHVKHRDDASGKRELC